MGRGNSDIIYFLETHEQEIINCCRKRNEQQRSS